MPKRSNWFQRLIKVIESQLAPEGAIVTESAMLPDRVVNEERGVDILIQTRSGIHDIVIGIECVGGASRPADVTWVEKIAGKHSHLPIDRSVLISRTGFSANAEKKAKALRMETLTLSEALDLSWPARLHEWPEAISVRRLRQLGIQVGIVSQESEAIIALGQNRLQEAELYSQSGECLGSLGEVVLGVLNREEVRQLYGKYPCPDAPEVWVLPLEIEDAANGYVVAADGIEISIEAVRVLAFATWGTENVPWERRQYGEGMVAYVDMPLEDTTATLVVAESRDRPPVAQITLGRPADRDLHFTLVLEEDVHASGRRNSSGLPSGLKHNGML